MKGFVRWYHLGSVAVAGAVVVVAAYLTFFSGPGQAIAQTTNIRGWAWSGTTGWISLNSANCSALPAGSCTTSNIPYGLNLVLGTPASGTINGYAWSQYAGWLCFGSTCGGPTPAGASPDITFTCMGVDKDGNPAPVACDTLTWSADTMGDAPSAELTGWARALNVQGSEGWIELRNNGVSLGPTATWVKLFFERGSCSNNLVGVCTSNAQCGVGTCMQQLGLGAGLGGWAWSYAGGGRCAGNSSISCASDTQCGAAAPCNNPPPHGLSWVSFDEGAPEVLFPYLQAQGGDVFSGGGVRTAFPPPASQYNAQYLVHVRGSLTSDLSARFRSVCTDLTLCRRVDYSLELPSDPTGDAPYTFTLGRFDFLGLIAATNCRCGSSSGGAGSTGAHSPAVVVDDVSVGDHAWATPAAAQVSDNSYAQVTLSDGDVGSHYLKATGFGFSVPANATITHITAEAEVYCEGEIPPTAWCQDLSVKLVKGGAVVGGEQAHDYDGSIPVPDDNTYQTYDFTSDIASLGLTPADVNAPGFGFAYALKEHNDGSQNDVDHLRLTVEYTTPAAATGTCRSTVPATSALPLCSAVTPMNKYNSPLSFSAPSFAAPLGGKVYLVDGDYNLPTGSSLTVLNGTAIPGQQSGAGTIVVRGDLNAGSDIAYENTSPANRQQLASLVWIVLGDVNVAPSVQSLAGTFIVLGHRKDFGICVGGTNSGAVCAQPSNCNGGTCSANGFGRCVDPGVTPYTTCTAGAGCSTGRQCIPWPSTLPNICVTPSTTSCVVDATCGGTSVCRSACLLKDANGDLNPGCGRFVTGTSSSAPLAVSGSVFARQFKLQRTYVDPVAKGPAERFTADGRLQLNPPPGMVDFAKGLPSFRRQ